MFAILLHESMDSFYENISSFPTVIFTFFLLLCVLFWLVAVLGFIEIDALDFDLPDGVEGDLGIEANSEFTNPDVLAGLMLKFGLYGVPVTIIITFISLLGWVISYYAVHFTFSIVPQGAWRYLVGLPILFGSFYVSVMLTGQVIKPMRPLFKKTEQDTVKQVLGQAVVVRTSRVDSGFGEAVLEDGGAGLILKVRSSGEDIFRKGDRVVLLEYFENENMYRVIAEDEFKG